MYFRLAFLISRINLAKAQRIDSFKIINTTVNFAFISKLEKLGLIRGFELDGGQLWVFMKYVDKRVPFVHMNLISRPGRVFSIPTQQLRQVIDKSGSTLLIMSTGYGFLTHTECFTLGCNGPIIVAIDL